MGSPKSKELQKKNTLPQISGYNLGTTLPVLRKQPTPFIKGF